MPNSIKEVENVDPELNNSALHHIFLEHIVSQLYSNNMIYMKKNSTEDSERSKAMGNFRQHAHVMFTSTQSMKESSYYPNGMNNH